MKNILLYTFFCSLLMTTMHITASKPHKRRQAPNPIVLQIKKDLAILTQITLQAQTIFHAFNYSSEIKEHFTAQGHTALTIASNAKKTIDLLLNSLNNPKIKDAITEDVETIKKATAENMTQSVKAYDSLLSKIETINAQAQQEIAQQEVI